MLTLPTVTFTLKSDLEREGPWGKISDFCDFNLPSGFTGFKEFYMALFEYQWSTKKKPEKYLFQEFPALMDLRSKSF